MRRLLCLLSLVGLAVSFLVTAPAARADGADDAAFLAAANAERSRAGVQQLRMSSDLVGVAAKQAQAMAAAGRIHHNPDLATDVTNWVTVAENVGRGADANQIHAAFMASSGHKANILDRRFSEVGIATVRAGDYLYVAQVFREPKVAAAAAPAPAPRPAPAQPAPAPTPAPAARPAPAPTPTPAPAPAPAPAPVALAAPAPQPVLPSPQAIAEATLAGLSSIPGPIVERTVALQPDHVVDLAPASGTPSKGRIALLAAWLLVGAASLLGRQVRVALPRLSLRTA